SCVACPFAPLPKFDRTMGPCGSRSNCPTTFLQPLRSVGTTCLVVRSRPSRLRPIAPVSCQSLRCADCWGSNRGSKCMRCSRSTTCRCSTVPQTSRMICKRNESSEFCPADDRRGRQRNVPDLLERLMATNFYLDESLLSAVCDRWLKP